jgi:hypothetical protein
VLAPLNVNVPDVLLVSAPTPDPSSITPPNVPLPTLNVVPFRRTTPLEGPSNVNNVTAAGERTVVPPTVSTVAGAKPAALPTVKFAPADTVTPVEVRRPVPPIAKVPAATVVVPL